MQRMSRDTIEAMTDRWLDINNEPLDDEERDLAEEEELSRAEARAEAILDGYL